MDNATWWTAFGAIAQAAGSVATFAAVVAALWATTSERRLSASGAVRFLVTFGGGEGSSHFVGFTVQNTGLRPIRVTGIGWRSGWMRRGPKLLRFRYAMQMLHGSQIDVPPFTVEPAMFGNVMVPVEILRQASGSKANVDMFRRRAPVLGHAPIKALFDISGRRSLVANVDGDVAHFLRTGEHTASGTSQA